MHDLIIIGAGPSGLLAACEAIKKGRKVLVLEARDRIGGRAFTHSGLEMGAEFIHGDLPILLSLLEEAGLDYETVTGEWLQLRGGETDEALTATAWPGLLQKLGSLSEDMSLQDFLEEHFADNSYATLKDRAISFAEGFDTADASRASAKALFEEWSGIEEEEQYRIRGGYSTLMDYLADEVKSNGGSILLSHPVTEINVNDSGVSVTAAGTIWTASQAIIAIPLGVLQQEHAIPITGLDTSTYKAALQSLGFGDVIKFVLEFREAFWEDEYPDLSFLLSSAAIPTWWTQLPQRNTILTGWLGGRGAHTHKSMSDAQLLDIAISSLAQLFSKDRAFIEGLLEEAHVANWSKDQYTLGSYVYATLGYETAIQVLRKPIGGRLFFAGEYMYSGSSIGTVEAAFWSARDTVERL